ncbi:MAG: UrcA family protein [Hyphomonadaceae bacterium]|nr:UrcA family protein [Hyphomonadaceae bacterium]
MKTVFAAAAAALALMAFAAPASAAPRGAQEVSIVVSYADLDLNHEAGARRLIQRVESAAERVCGYDNGVRGLSARRAYRACVQETMADALAPMSHPVVAQLFRSDRARG